MAREAVLPIVTYSITSKLKEVYISEEAVYRIRVPRQLQHCQVAVQKRGGRAFIYKTNFENEDSFRVPESCKVNIGWVLKGRASEVSYYMIERGDDFYFLVEPRSKQSLLRSLQKGNPHPLQGAVLNQDTRRIQTSGAITCPFEWLPENPRVLYVQDVGDKFTLQIIPKVEGSQLVQGIHDYISTIGHPRDPSFEGDRLLKELAKIGDLQEHSVYKRSSFNPGRLLKEKNRGVVPDQIQIIRTKEGIFVFLGSTDDLEKIIGS